MRRSHGSFDRKALKIGIDCRLWSESGVGRYVRNLVCELAKVDSSNDYVLFGLGRDVEDIKLKVQSAKFKVVRVDIRWHSFREQIEFPKILNRENLDLVHFPYFSVPIFYNRPFVVTIHDLILHHFPTGQASTLPLSIYYAKLGGYKFVISQAAKKAKKIIAVSNATKSEIVDHLSVDPGKVEVIYEGVENLKLKTQNSKLHLKTQNYFLYVGNVYPHKNVDRLIKAIERLRTQNLELKTVFVGKEDYFYKSLKEKVRELGLGDSIVFLGEVSDGELAWLYKHSIALVAPSLMEGFGLTVLEAMASSCLVVVSDIPAFREVCGDAAIYFDPNSSDNILNKLLLVLKLSDKEKEKNIVNGLKRVKMFSWNKMADQTLKVYTNAI